jgi:hypothetical protein
MDSTRAVTPVGRELPNRTAHMGMRMRAASADDDITAS